VGVRYRSVPGRRPLAALLNRPLFGKPLFVWLLWAAAVAVLAGCPVIISDPGMWPYLLDPELLALVVIVGAQYTRLEAGVLKLQAQAWWRRRRDGASGRPARR
jgi:hypothetical protein